MKATSSEVAARFNVPIENVRRLYAANAEDLRVFAAKAGTGKYRGKTAAEWTDYAEHAETCARRREPVIRRSGGKFTVKLASVGNPDYGQDPDQSMHGVPTAWAHVETLVEARELCRRFIAFFELGGGNWAGGEVVRQSDGLVIGWFSYNGRLWADKSAKNEICVS